MFYTYITHYEKEYGFGVCCDLLYKNLPDGLCYFEVFNSKKEAKERKEYLKKLSYTKLSTLIKSKKGNGFLCHKEGEKTVISLKNCVYNLTGAILVKGENIVIRGKKALLYRVV